MLKNDTEDIAFRVLWKLIIVILLVPGLDVKACHMR
jgi:hypothetical protein